MQTGLYPVYEVAHNPSKLGYPPKTMDNVEAGREKMRGEG